jgi:lactoylglutathione lyase
MSDGHAHEPDAPERLPRARWTHVALPVANLDASIAWYQDFTPLRLLDRRSDDQGDSVWLGDPDLREAPFVLVLVSFSAERGHGPLTTMAPFAHLGIELTSRHEVDAVADRARAQGCLLWEPRQMAEHIGYICAASDPDGNVVEFSFDQGVYVAARARWG